MISVLTAVISVLSSVLTSAISVLSSVLTAVIDLAGWFAALFLHNENLNHKQYYFVVLYFFRRNDAVLADPKGM